MWEIAENLDQAKALAHEHHVLTESSEPAEIGSMGAPPIGQAPIAFTLIVRKGGVDFIETAIRYFGGFDDAARFSTSIEHDPAFTGRRAVRLVFPAAGCGLHAFDYKSKQFICELGTVAKGERAQVLIALGDRLTHGQVSRDNGLEAMEAGSLAGWIRCASAALGHLGSGRAAFIRPHAPIVKGRNIVAPYGTYGTCRPLQRRFNLSQGLPYQKSN
jgi:hypothetical protein